jgi:hypothetical protein
MLAVCISGIHSKQINIKYSTHQRKQAKLQWLQDRSEINGDNLNNIRRESSRHFKNKKREYMKDKTDELATNSKNKNIRDLYRKIKPSFKSRFIKF